MRTVTITHHRVADYDAWKQVYDSVREVQREGGVREHAVLRPADDPTMVVVVHTFDSPEAAKAFFDSPALKGAMGQAGVDMSSLRIDFLQEEEAGKI
jgi:heme-degrading monooxygenase HmoA